MKNSKEFIRGFIDRNVESDGVLKHLPFVYKIAQEYSEKNKFICFEDIFQAGVLGLIDSYKLFNKEKGFTFTSYAVKGIKRSIITYISNHNFKLKIPIHNYANIVDEFCNPQKHEKHEFGYLLDHNNYESYNDSKTNCNYQNECTDFYFENKEIKDIILKIVSKMSEKNKKMFSYGIIYNDKRFNHYKHKNKYYKSKSYELFKKEFIKILKSEYGFNMYNEMRNYLYE